MSHLDAHRQGGPRLQLEGPTAGANRTDVRRLLRHPGEAAGRSRCSALRALRRLQELNVLDPAPDGPRGQLRWRATEVLEILTDEPDPADS